MERGLYQEIAKEIGSAREEVNKTSIDAINESPSELKISEKGEINSTQVHTEFDYIDLTFESPISLIDVENCDDSSNNGNVVTPNNTSEKHQNFGDNNTLTYNSPNTRNKIQDVSHSNLSTTFKTAFSTNFLIHNLLANSFPKTSCGIAANKQSHPDATLEPVETSLSVSEFHKIKQKSTCQLECNFSPLKLEKSDREVLEFDWLKKDDMLLTDSSCVENNNSTVVTVEDDRPNEELKRKDQLNHTISKSMCNSLKIVSC